MNSDKQHGPKSSDSTKNEIATRDNLPWPNCDSDGKGDNKRQAFINTDTRRFKIQTGDMGPPASGRASLKTLSLKADLIILSQKSITKIPILIY